MIPPFGFSVTFDPLFCSPKNEVIPPMNYSPPPLPGDNGRSLRLVGSRAYTPRQKSLKPPYTSLSLSKVDVIAKLRVSITTLQKGGGKEEREREIFQSVSKFLSKIVSLLWLHSVFLIMSKIVALELTTL